MTPVSRTVNLTLRGVGRLPAARGRWALQGRLPGAAGPDQPWLQAHGRPQASAAFRVVAAASVSGEFETGEIGVAGSFPSPRPSLGCGQ